MIRVSCPAAPKPERTGKTMARLVPAMTGQGNRKTRAIDMTHFELSADGAPICGQGERSRAGDFVNVECVCGHDLMIAASTLSQGCDSGRMKGS